MKKSLGIFISLFFLVSYTLDSQSVFSRVKNAVTKEITGTSSDNSSGNTSKKGPEPQCAREDAILIADLSKFKLDYNEISICEMEDGSILLKDKRDGKYYLVRDGKSEGPLTENDPRVTECVYKTGSVSDNNDDDEWTKKYPSYITKSGDKYSINFNGTKYGSFALISDFAVSASKDKFAAVVTENVAITEDQSKKMEAELEKAKTDQERLEISMKYSEQMTAIMMQPGGTESLQPKMVSNIPGALYDAMKWMGGRLNNKVKYNDIVVVAPDRIVDLKGKTLVTLTSESYNAKNLFLSSSGTKYATYNYGTLTFSDKTKLSDLFRPRLVNSDGKVNLAYMYYSPGKNAIMQASIPF